MPTLSPVVVRVGDVHEAETQLAHRVHEFNPRATGFGEAESFCAAVQDETAALLAGIGGSTWGGGCRIDHLWVDTSQRRRGPGSSLVKAVERHTRGRGCLPLIVSPHRFQAPAICMWLAFQAQAVVPDHPPGHTNVVLAKWLPAA